MTDAADKPRVKTSGVPIWERPSLAELAGMVARAKSGGGCPRCGCRDWRPIGGYTAEGQKYEKRACRNCGQSLPAQPIDG